MKIENNHYLNFSSILFYCIPIFLITGPFLPDLCVAIISSTYIYKIIKDSQYKIFNSIFVKIFILFFFYILLGSILSDNIRLSLSSSAFYFRFLFFSLAVFFLLDNKKLSIRYLKNIFIIIYVILFIDSVFQLIFDKNMIGLNYANQNNFRITSFFGENEILGSYIARFYPFFIFLFFFESYQSTKTVKTFQINLLTILSIIIVFLSGERTALALIIISILIIYISSINLRRYLIFVLGIFIIAIFLVSQFYPKVKNRMIDSTIQQMGLSHYSERIVVFSKTYEGHYRIALNMFSQKPLFGHGIKIFRHYCSKKENFVAPNACTTHPHNIYMQFLAETGIFGFLFFLLIFISLAYMLAKNVFFLIFKKIKLLQDHTMCLYSFYFVTLFPFVPSGNFFNNWLSVVYFIPLGFLLYVLKLDNKFRVHI